MCHATVPNRCSYILVWLTLIQGRSIRHDTKPSLLQRVIAFPWKDVSEGMLLILIWGEDLSSKRSRAHPGPPLVARRKHGGLTRAQEAERRCSCRSICCQLAAPAPERPVSCLPPQSNVLASPPHFSFTEMRFPDCSRKTKKGAADRQQSRDPAIAKCPLRFSFSRLGDTVCVRTTQMLKRTARCQGGQQRVAGAVAA